MQGKAEDADGLTPAEDGNAAFALCSSVLLPEILMIAIGLVWKLAKGPNPESYSATPR